MSLGRILRHMVLGAKIGSAAGAAGAVIFNNEPRGSTDAAAFGAACGGAGGAVLGGLGSLTVGLIVKHYCGCR